MVKLLLKEFGKRFSRIIEEIANKEPSAGLENNQTDFKDLGYSYEFVELAGWRYIRGFKLRMIEQFHKDRERAQALGCVKFNTWREALADYDRRHKIAIMKSKLVNPPICSLKGVE
jgi:NH3-dependent NAD+ synthetase